MNEVLFEVKYDPKVLIKKAIEKTEKYNKKRIVRSGKHSRKVLITFVAHASGDNFFNVENEDWNKLDPGKDSHKEIINKFYNERLKTERLKVWKEKVLEFAKEEFGGKLLQVNLHMDEKTPHIHIDIIPWKDGRLNKKGLYPKKEFLKMKERYDKKVNVPMHLEMRGPYARKKSVDFRFYKVLKRAGVDMKYYSSIINFLKKETLETVCNALKIDKNEVKSVGKGKDNIVLLKKYYKTNLAEVIKKVQDAYENQIKRSENHMNNGKERY